MKILGFFFTFFCISNFIYSQIPNKSTLWLKADSGVVHVNNLVSEWNDVSGNKFKAYQPNTLNRPTFISNSINGTPGIRFGTNLFMLCSNVFPVNSDYTLSVVIKSLNISNSNIVGGNNRTLWMAGSNHAQVIHNGDFTNQLVSSKDIGNDPTVLTVQYNSANQIGIIRVNGVFIDSSFCPRNNDSTIYLSTYTSAGGNNFIGDINEVILFNKVLNKNDLDITENYLLKKYNILKPINSTLSDSNIILFPKSNQFYCRGLNDSSLVPVKGKIVKTGFDSVYLLVYKNGILINKIFNKIIFENNKSNYLFLPKIHSELSEYKFVLGIKSKLQDSIIIVSDSIVCGDFYIISGQSNTIFGGNNYKNEYCRTFGKNYSLKKSDTLWTVANGSASGGGPDIGAWGMKLSQLIIEKYKIPICIINGGVGGTTVEQNQRNDLFPLEPTNIYNSINYRVEKSGLRKFVKAIFWYQGESNSSIGYYLGMKALYQDWQVDYPDLKKFYIMQTHHGCSSDGSSVREIHRTIQDSLPKIEVLSPHGVPFHDGCHYALAGYNILADRIFGVVARDFYYSVDTVSISAPNIKKAFYTTDIHNEIALVFSPEKSGLIIQSDTLNQSIKEYFYFGKEKSYGNVDSIFAIGDTIILKLKTPSNSQFLSYTPDQFYNNTQITFEGPYIKNKKGIGALTFNLFPIVDKNTSDVEFANLIKKLRLSSN